MLRTALRLFLVLPVLSLAVMSCSDKKPKDLDGQRIIAMLDSNGYRFGLQDSTPPIVEIDPWTEGDIARYIGDGLPDASLKLRPATDQVRYARIRVSAFARADTASRRLLYVFATGIDSTLGPWVTGRLLPASLTVVESRDTLMLGDVHIEFTAQLKDTYDSLVVYYLTARTPFGRKYL